MITEHQEIARHQVTEQLRAAERRGLRKQERDAQRTARGVNAPRRELAGVLRRLADRLEPQPRPRRAGLSLVR
ncbi:hypothetical protein Kfla_6819 [Kribbella flavida DSM 17836]|uniref:Uncharacterized protein n=1 Tax=Kribbella flavida (strain DSM 17836 / JCM 10339 / NBRC 14399) TaxID=479435 RepID=D2Q2B4_KRIFD|nr:hypothetical protein [Kribbella flavida]ADB35810.1 hypothetical protein Kfla_6819 [Kribbella flavida DSM 17836]